MMFPKHTKLKHVVYLLTLHIVLNEVLSQYPVNDSLNVNTSDEPVFLKTFSDVLSPTLVKKVRQKSALRNEPVDSEEEMKNLLEEKYKFVNDRKTKRYKVTKAENISQGTEGKAVEKRDDKNIAWVFRADAARRIVGGMETSVSMYPYNVAISRNARHWCGGSVIDEQWVITAGHCMEVAFEGGPNSLVSFIIRAGSSFHNRGGYQARVNKVFFPPDYSPGNADFDYSLLRLDRPLPIGRNIAVLNLPAKEYGLNEDDMLIVTGWGSTSRDGFGNIPDRLRFVPVPIMNLTTCQSSYRFFITPRMLCAGYATGGKDACNHDSGGPAVREGALLGVVSFGGKQCGNPRSPGVYSRVSEVSDWVEKTITENEAYTVPELVPKIKKQRQREQELQSFKARVENKKNKIKTWLRDTLRSPSFIQLAKKKLAAAGFGIRKQFDEEPKFLDDKMLDEINFSNMISERILEGDSESEAENMIHALALEEVMMQDQASSAEKDFEKFYDKIQGVGTPSLVPNSTVYTNILNVTTSVTSVSTK